MKTAGQRLPTGCAFVRSFVNLYRRHRELSYTHLLVAPANARGTPHGRRTCLEKGCFVTKRGDAAAAAAVVECTITPRRRGSHANTASRHSTLDKLPPVHDRRLTDRT